ncbi:hypothetical protein M9458_039849, partial [Cirrhinus mrigala]
QGFYSPYFIVPKKGGGLQPIWRWAWCRGTQRVNITPVCRRSFSPWSDLVFLRAGVPLEQVSRHVIVMTDASSTGWDTT